jgi:hypothetical protein
MKTENLCIAPRNHFLQIWPVFIYMIAFIAMPFYFMNRYKGETLDLIYSLGIGVLFVLIIPMLVLHIRYYTLNRNVTIELSSKSLFSINHLKITKRINKTDIKTINIYMSYSAYYHGLRVLPMDNYFYGFITLSSGEEILITTLLDPELLWLKHLSPEKVMVHRSLFCFC